MSRTRAAAPSPGWTRPQWAAPDKENRDAEVPDPQALPRQRPATVNDVPMDQWTPEEVDAHMKFMDDFGKRLEAERRVRRRAGAVAGGRVRPGGRAGPADHRRAVRRDQGPHRRVVRRRRRRLGPRVELAGELSLAPGHGRQADPRVARGAPLLRRADRDRGLTRAVTDAVRRGDAAAAGAGGHRRPRPPRSRLRDGRGRRAGRARRGGAHVRRRTDAAARPEGLAGHRRVAAVPRRRTVRDRAAAARGRGRRRAGRRPDRDGRRHAARLLPLRAPGADAGVRRRADAAGRRRPDDAAGRRGLPGARGDDGAADQPREADGVGRVVRPAG